MVNEARRHGHIRGWVKTGISGQYQIRTVRPGPYPGQDLPAHIHLLVREPGVANEYYIDDINFEDDPLLIPYQQKHPFDRRGGSGVLRVELRGDTQVAKHTVVSGLNIPDYPFR